MNRTDTHGEVRTMANIQGADKPKLYVTDIPAILESPVVHTFTKDTIRMAMTKDPIDAMDDLKLALAAVEAWADDILNR